MAARRWWSRVLVVLVAVSLGGCGDGEFSVDSITEYVPTKDLASSSEPEEKRAEALRDAAARSKAASEARDAWLTNHTRSSLDEALRLSPDDPELLAYDLLERKRYEAGLVKEYGRSDRAGQGRDLVEAMDKADVSANKLREKVTTLEYEKIRAKTPRDDPDVERKLLLAATERALALRLLNAEAAMLVGALEGKILLPPTGAASPERLALFRSYCIRLNSFFDEHGSGEGLLNHQKTFSHECPSSLR